MASERLKRAGRPIYHGLQDLVQGDILRQNAALKDLYRGRRCFLLCTGASLRDIDVDELHGELLFGTGHLHSPHLDLAVQSGRSRLGFQHAWPRQLRLDFYAAVDPVWESVSPPDLVRYFIDFWHSVESTFGDSDVIFFANGADVSFFRRHRLLENRRLHFVKTLCPMAQATVQRHDLSRRITFMDGSFYFMIAASVYMGFEELFLCGCDYTFEPARSGHYYEDWVLMERRPVDDHHRIAREFAEAHGVRIWNVVPDGFESPVFEKISWTSVLERLRREPHVAAAGVRDSSATQLAPR